MKLYSIIEDGSNAGPIMQVTEDVVVMLQKANDLAMGRQILVWLFEWFLGVIQQVYADQGISSKDRIELDPSFFDVLAKATRFGLKAYVLYEEIFEGGDAETG